MVSMEIRKTDKEEFKAYSKVKNKLSLLDHLAFVLVGLVVLILTLFPLTELYR